jgi:hypothetical protein
MGTTQTSVPPLASVLSISLIQTSIVYTEAKLDKNTGNYKE